MVAKKGRPKTGESPQKPRITFTISIPFEDKNIVDEFRKNCATINLPFSHVLLKKMIEINKSFVDAFIPKEESTEKTAQESISEDNFESEEDSMDDESEDEIEEESEEESKRELMLEEAKEEREEESNVQ